VESHGKADTSFFGNFEWLSIFHSDQARLAAIGIASLALVLIYCIVPLARVWAADRQDQRDHERKKQILMASIGEELARRRAGRLNLDD